MKKKTKQLLCDSESKITRLRSVFQEEQNKTLDYYQRMINLKANLFELGIDGLENVEQELRDFLNDPVGYEKFNAIAEQADKVGLELFEESNKICFLFPSCDKLFALSMVSHNLAFDIRNYLIDKLREWENNENGDNFEDAD